jgi:flagellar hook assembly protein FlgD
LKVVFKIYSILEHEIRTLVNAFENEGTKSVIWNGKNNEGVVVSTGIYFYRIQSGDLIKNHKMILMK